MYKKIVFVFIIILIFFYISPLYPSYYKELKGSSIDNIPFTEKEELTYHITWMGISAGTAKMCIKEKINKWNKELYHIASQADSSEFVSLIYKVKDRAHSYIDTSGIYPWYYSIKQREGRYRANRIIIFDQENNKAFFTKNDNPPREFSVPSMVQDPLSTLYFLRTKDLTIGKSVYIDTFSGKKTHRVEVQIVKREKLKTIFGKIDTILTKAILENIDFKGIFRHKGNIFIWLTNDKKKLPVMMKTRIFIGSVNARLIDYKE